MGVLKKLTEEYFGVSMRKEDGMVFDIGGKKYGIRFDDYGYIIKHLIPMDDDGSFFVRKEFGFLDEPVYVCCDCIETRKPYRCSYYCITETDLKETTGGTIRNGSIFLLGIANTDDHSANFMAMDILSVGGFPNFKISPESSMGLKRTSTHMDVFNKGLDYYIYDNQHSAETDAIEKKLDSLSQNFGSAMDMDDVDNFMDKYRAGWIERDKVLDFLRNNNIKDDMKMEDSRYGNHLFGDLVLHHIIEDTDDYFAVDLNEPKFDPEEYRDELVARLSEETGVSGDEATDTVDGYDKGGFIRSLIKCGIVKKTGEYFGLDHDSPLFDVDTAVGSLLAYMDTYKAVNMMRAYQTVLYDNFYDLKRLAEEIVGRDGRASVIGRHDKKEHVVEVGGKRYFVYID